MGGRFFEGVAFGGDFADHFGTQGFELIVEGAEGTNKVLAVAFAVAGAKDGNGFAGKVQACPLLCQTGGSRQSFFCTSPAPQVEQGRGLK